MAHGRPGPAPQTAKREQLARLIARGVSNTEACRIVGVNRRTGKRWRHGRTITSTSGARLHYPPVIGARRREISPRYLSEVERVGIADLRRAGLGVRAIAAELKRSPSTVSRELRRNREPSSGQYRPFAAQRLAAERRSRPGRGKLIRDPVLREFVAGRLEKRWSPEQVCQALRREFPGDPGRHLVHETIYQAVYRPELGGLRRDLPKVLRTGRRRRKPHRRPDARGNNHRARTVSKITLDIGASSWPPTPAERRSAKVRVRGEPGNLRAAVPLRRGCSRPGIWAS
jgi:IS30 family transposase